MNFVDFLFILSTYLMISVILSLIFYGSGQVKASGNYWALFFTAFIGAVLGGVIYLLGKDFFLFFTDLNHFVNIYPPLIASYIAAKIFLKVFKGNGSN